MVVKVLRIAYCQSQELEEENSKLKRQTKISLVGDLSFTALHEKLRFFRNSRRSFLSIWKEPSALLSLHRKIHPRRGLCGMLLYKSLFEHEKYLTLQQFPLNQ